MKSYNIYKRLLDYWHEIKENGLFILYMVFILAIMLISFVLAFAYVYNPSSNQNIENARYLLSAIIQGLAAIFAIVITITFVSVQLASQNYSPRVVRIFTHSNSFWYLLLLFTLTIFSASYLLTYLNAEIAFLSSLSVITLTASCFLVLGEYIRSVPKILSLEFLLKKSFKNINEKFFKTIAKRSEQKEDEILLNISESEDPFLLYFDITINAIERKNLAILRSANIILRNDIEQKILNNVINKDNEKVVAKYYMNHIGKILELELDAKDDNAIRYTYETIEYIGKIACKTGLEKFLDEIRQTILSNEIINLEKDNPPNIWAINILNSILDCIITKNYSNDLIYDYINAIFNLTYDAGERGYYHFPYDGILKLKDIKSKLTEKSEISPNIFKKLDQFIEELTELDKKL
ncbi:DUF2254 family protein [Candidatus Pyrohabitans sp.]